MADIDRQQSKAFHDAKALALQVARLTQERDDALLQLQESAMLYLTRDGECMTLGEENAKLTRERDVARIHANTAEEVIARVTEERDEARDAEQEALAALKHVRDAHAYTGPSPLIEAWRYCEAAEAQVLLLARTLTDLVVVCEEVFDSFDSRAPWPTIAAAREVVDSLPKPETP